jgi:L-aspartate oxidase
MDIHDNIDCEVLIIGSGVAGCVAALQLADAGIPVVVVTRSSAPEETNTRYAQGGIIYTSPDDSPELLEKDIIHAGAGYCNPRAVEILAMEGPKLVKSILLDKVQIPFDKTRKGELSLVREGGHSLPRILHAKDATGSLIERCLIQAIQSNPNVTLLTGKTAIDLLTPAHHAVNRLTVYDPLTCVGAYLLDQKTGHVQRVLSRATILATGGVGQLFLRTTNPVGARGDGLAMASRAGARAINCEFVQFHPTAFYQENGPCFLITEAMRGAGARLVNEKMEPFMQKYDPEWKDLAPRDVVSRSIHYEMLERNIPNVFLDIASYLPAEDIKRKFPSVNKMCLQAGIDISTQPIPVIPAAHFFCGGVWVDEWGRTTLGQLYAIGEVSCTGLHGANRLASTSLLEGVVWGHRSAMHIKEGLKRFPKPRPEEYRQWEETGTEYPDPILIAQDMSLIKNIMWHYTGLVRTFERLQRAMSELRHLESEIQRFYRTVKLTDGILGLRNAVRSAVTITIAAWENNTSAGCHYRE